MPSLSARFASQIRLLAPAVALLLLTCTDAVAVHEPVIDIDMDAASYVPCIGVELALASVDGQHFDGLSYYYPLPDDLCVVPEVASSLGFRVSVGVRRIDPPLHFLGANYSRSTHEGTWFGLPQPVVSQTVLVGGRYISSQPWPVRPYVFAGFGLRRLSIEDAHYHDGSPSAFVADLNLQGFGGEVGIGVEYPVSRHLILTAALRGEAFSLSQASSNGLANQSFQLSGLLARGISVSGGLEVVLAF
ncbi:MAG: hypothetical protein ABIE42_04780 [Candidatus Eisenbacteria bacterium]